MAVETAPIEQRQLLTTRQAARLLAISPRSLYRLVDAGRLRPVRLGGPYSRLRFEAREVVALIDQGRKEDA